MLKREKEQNPPRGSQRTLLYDPLHLRVSYQILKLKAGSGNFIFASREEITTGAHHKNGRPFPPPFYALLEIKLSVGSERQTE